MAASVTMAGMCSPSPAQGEARLTALVLLDAVNERITHLAAQSLPEVQIGARDSFEDMYSKVKEARGRRGHVTTVGRTCGSCTAHATLPNTKGSVPTRHCGT